MGRTSRKVNLDDLFRMPSTSHAVVADGTVYLSGILGTVGAGLDLADGGVAGQTAQAIANVGRVLEACGCSLDDVVKATVYLTSPQHFLDMEGAFAAGIASQPARVAVYCSELPLGALVELDAVALAAAPS